MQKETVTKSFVDKQEDFTKQKNDKKLPTLINFRLNSIRIISVNTFI